IIADSNQPSSVRLRVDDDGRGFSAETLDERAADGHVGLRAPAGLVSELGGPAWNGNQAIAPVARLQPDLVLMDLSMPELDGVEATRRISADHPSARVLVLTSFSDQTRILDALSAGAER